MDLKKLKQDKESVRENPDEDWVKPAVVAEHLDITENVLAIMRHRGEGPSYSKMSRRAIRYLMSDVHRWMRSCRINCAG